MTIKVVSGELLDDYTELSLSELCRACATHAEWIIALVDEGVLEPGGDIHTQWRFSLSSLNRARVARRLQQDLNVNLAGVALALDLLDQIKTLRARLNIHETSSSDL